MMRTLSPELIAHHEAGHAAIGHFQGLTFDAIYLGDASGQVNFDEQWEREAVFRNPALLDRYALMLLSGGHVEHRYAGSVAGAGQDEESLERLLSEARSRGTIPRPGVWQRSAQQVADHWPSIRLLADELTHRGTPVANLAQVVGQYPHLAGQVAEISGARAREVLDCCL